MNKVKALMAAIEEVEGNDPLPVLGLRFDLGLYQRSTVVVEVGGFEVVLHEDGWYIKDTSGG